MVCDYCAHPRPPHKAGCDEFQLDAVPECWFVSAVFPFIFITCPLNKTLPKGADSLQWHERGFGSRKLFESLWNITGNSPFLGVWKYGWWHLDFDLQFLKFQWPKMRFKPRDSQINSENGIWVCLKFFSHHFYPNKFDLELEKYRMHFNLHVSFYFALLSSDSSFLLRTFAFYSLIAQVAYKNKDYLFKVQSRLM